jgi:hypothetical protein
MEYNACNMNNWKRETELKEVVDVNAKHILG